MTLTHPTAARNYLADAHDDYVNTGSGTAVLQILEGSTVLCEMNLSNPAFGDASSGTIELNSTPLTGTVTETGVADAYQVVNANGDVAHSGSITSEGGGGDIELNYISLTKGFGVYITSYSYTAAP